MSSGEDMLRAGISQLQNGELAAHSPGSPTAQTDYHSWRLTDSIGADQSGAVAMYGYVRAVLHLTCNQTNSEGGVPSHPV